jgi:hypothetical protein
MTRRSSAGRLLAGLSVVVTSGLGLAACGDPGTSLAQQACVDVHRSIADLDRARDTPDPAAASRLRVDAQMELIRAVPITAQAANADAQWQGLMTTVSEINRVQEQTLVPALEAACRQTATNVFGQTPPPSKAG